MRCEMFSKLHFGLRYAHSHAIQFLSIFKPPFFPLTNLSNIMARAENKREKKFSWWKTHDISRRSIILENWENVETCWIPRLHFWD